MSSDQTPDDQTPVDQEESGESGRAPGPRGGVPQSIGLLFAFGLMAAGIVALVGFAIDKGAEKDESASIDPANAAAAELLETYDEFAPGTEALFKAEQDLGTLPADAVFDAPLEEDEESGGSPANGDAPEADLDDPEALLAAAAASLGRDLFFSNGCSVCHGDSGEGAIGPTIAQTGLTLSQVVGQYRTPRDAMLPFTADRVSDQEVAHIYAWLQTQDLPEMIIEGLGTP